MKKIALFAAAATLVGFAVPAFAAPAAVDASGTVHVTGTVTPKCATIGTDSVDLDVGELANGSGAVVSTFAQNTHAAFTVTCTSAAPTVTVAASALTNVNSAATGYTNVVDYKAVATATDANGASVAPYIYTDGSNAGHDVLALAAPIANTTDNVQIDISHPTAASGKLLVAGSYAGTVTVTVSPTS